jgi:hypothetical protein
VFPVMGWKDGHDNEATQAYPGAGCQEDQRGRTPSERGPGSRRGDLVAVIEDLVLTRGAPEYLRPDNGPEMIAWALRDYCRLAGTKTA